MKRYFLGIWIIIGLIAILFIFNSRSITLLLPQSSKSPLKTNEMSPEDSIRTSAIEVLKTLKLEHVDLSYIDPIVLTYSIENKASRNFTLEFKGIAYYDDIFVGPMESATLDWEVGAIEVGSNQKVMMIFLVEIEAEGLIDSMASRAFWPKKDKWEFRNMNVTVGCPALNVTVTVGGNS